MRNKKTCSNGTIPTVNVFKCQSWENFKLLTIYLCGCDTGTVRFSMVPLRKTFAQTDLDQNVLNICPLSTDIKPMIFISKNIYNRGNGPKLDGNELRKTRKNDWNNPQKPQNDHRRNRKRNSGIYKTKLDKLKFNLLARNCFMTRNSNRWTLKTAFSRRQFCTFHQLVHIYAMNQFASPLNQWVSQPAFHSSSFLLVYW